MPNGLNEHYIVCEDLFKIYKIADLEVVALRGLDLVLSRGEVAAIVGASGSGKSTLLNILAGFDSPSAGRVVVGDNNLLNMSSKEIEVYRRDEVGFVWQQTSRNLFPYLTALENVALPMMLTDLPVKERQTRAAELLNIVGLGKRMDHVPEKLSGGEQQRVAIAVGLANHPSLLMADEPTGELDDATAGEILDVFSSVNNKLGTTILIVSHDPDIAYKVDRVILIRDGKTSMEIVNADYNNSENVTESSLKRFTLVDTAGRVQIPKEFLDELAIKDRATVNLENDRLTIVSGDE